MKRFPVEPKRRNSIEMSIRVIDIVIYLAVFAGGIYALWFTPITITDQLIGWEWLIPWWASFLLVGGLVGFIGRLTTVWVLEPPATLAGSVGVLIYFVVLSRTAFHSITSTVAVCLFLVAFVALIRRYFELQLFGSDPAHNDLKSKIADTLMRRTPNVPPRG